MPDETETTEETTDTEETAPETTEETPKEETPKEETPKEETPKEETPKEETPKEDALTALLAKFGEQLNSIQERQEAVEARIKAEDEAKAVAARAAKLGIPADLLTIDRDADPEAFAKALQAYARGQLPASKAPTPTLPSVGHGEPGGAVQTVDEMLRAAEAEGNHEAISVFKAMKLSDAASKMI